MSITCFYFRKGKKVEDEVKYFIKEKIEPTTKAHVDIVFFKQLMKLIKIAIPSWTSLEAGLLVVIAGSLVARSLCDLWIINFGTKIER